MLFLPVLLFITHGYLANDAISTRPLLKEQCVEFVKQYTEEMNKKAPEGSMFRGLCIPIGDDVKAAPKAPTELTDESEKTI